MSNNRLYIKDTETGEKFLLAKGWGNGWRLHPIEYKFNKWMTNRDIAASESSLEKTKLVLETE